MNFFTRMSIAALMVPFIQCQGADFDSGSDSDSEAVGAEALPLVTNWYLTGASTNTGLSGYAGADIHTHGNPNATQAGVFAILSRERSDDPCYVMTGTEDLDDRLNDTLIDIDHCGSAPTSTTLHGDYLDVSAGGSGDHNFIWAVNVCMNSNNDKVKGISVAGLRLNSNGSLTYLPSVTTTRPNCDHWAGWASCTGGKIATAVDVHFAAGNEPKELTGLSLYCKTLTY